MLLWPIVGAGLVTSVTIHVRKHHALIRATRAHTHATAALAPLNQTGRPASRAHRDVLARARWTAADTDTVLAETGHDRTAADQILTGITMALALDPILGRDRLSREAATVWARVGMLLLDAGVPRTRLRYAVRDAITIYDPALPLRYTAWAYAASLGKDEANRHWRHAMLTSVPVQRLAQNLGADLTHPHPIASAAA